MAEAFQYVALADGTVQSLSLYVNADDTAPAIVVGLYGNASGHPGTLLTSATISSPTAGAWNTVNVPPVAVSAETTYWLAALAPSGELALRDIASGGGPTQNSGSSALGTLPSSWSVGTSWKNSPASFYASETTVGTQPPPPPPPPTASFTYSPTSPVVGQSVNFDGTSSTCPDGSCTYEWSEDGGPTRPIPPLWPLGGGQTLSLTFSSAGTKYMRLLVTDVLGQTATVEHNVVVAAEPPPPPPPSAPSNTAPPSVSGSAQVGRTLTTSNGEWGGSTPIAYTYQWQRDGSTDIVGATNASYTPIAGDVGHTLDVVVTASNSVGSTSATSAQTAPVSSEVSGGQQTNCFSTPSACGYPDPTNTGVPAGTKLEAQAGKIVVSTPGTTIKDLNLNGEIEVMANNTTIEDDEITLNGTQKGCSSPCGGNAIKILSGVSGVVVKHVSCHGGAAEGENVTTFCFRNEGAATNRYEYDQIHYTAACFWGTGIYENNYCLDNGNIPNAHYDGIYVGGGEGELKMVHNTMLQPHEQTAAIFLSHDDGNVETIKIEDNLLAGGGYVIYGGGSGQNEFKVLGPVVVTGNRFARCLTKEVFVAEGGHHVCEGGYDSHGYYPNGGSYGLDSYFNEAVTTWSNNYWDDTLEQVPPL